MRQQTYTLHKSKRQTLKPLNHYYVGRSHIQFQADIVDYSKYQTWNQGYKYILIVMDIFSRKAWAFPLKSKSRSEMATTLDQLFRHIRPQERLQIYEGQNTIIIMSSVYSTSIILNYLAYIPSLNVRM